MTEMSNSTVPIERERERERERVSPIRGKIIDIFDIALKTNNIGYTKTTPLVSIFDTTLPDRYRYPRDVNSKRGRPRLDNPLHLNNHVMLPDAARYGKCQIYTGFGFPPHMTLRPPLRKRIFFARGGVGPRAHLRIFWGLPPAPSRPPGPVPRWATPAPARPTSGHRTRAPGPCPAPLPAGERGTAPA